MFNEKKYVYNVLLIKHLKPMMHIVIYRQKFVKNY